MKQLSVTGHPLFTLAAALCLGLFLLPSAAQMNIPYEKIRGPICVIREKDTGAPGPLSPERSQYNVIITDGFAHIRLTQMYVNTYRNAEDIAYVFPLPHEGAIHGMSLEYRDSLYVAKIHEREEAKKIYEEVKQSGGNAALLLQDKPNIFQQRLANIGYGDTAFVRIELSLPLKYDNGEFEMAVPTMVAERFQSGGGTAKAAALSSRWNPPENIEGQRLQFNVLIKTGYPITDLHSPTHPLTVSGLEESRETLVKRRLLEEETNVGTGYVNCGFLLTKDTYPNRDYVLRFNRQYARHDFSVASNYDPERKKGFFAFSLYPDTALFKGDSKNLEVVLLVDRSGSQNGWPLLKEKEISNIILSNLNETDRLTVLSFSDDVQWAFGENKIVSASSENLATAKRFVNDIRSAGGTQLLNAVKSALSVPLQTEHRRIYIFLTDGFITNESAIFDAIRKHPSAPTVFTFGAGNNLNRLFLEDAAKIGNGFSTPVTQNDNLGALVQSAWAKIKVPQLSNISIYFDGIRVSELVWPPGRQLFRGSPYCLYGQYTGSGEGVVTLEAYRGGAPVAIEKKVNFASEADISRMLPQLWARKKIAALRLDEGTGAKNKVEIIQLSEEYQVLTRYTAFLAIQPEPVPEGLSARDSEYFSSTDVLDALNLSESLKIMVREGFVWIEAPAGTRLLKIQICDLRGRVVFKWQAGTSTETDSRFQWDGRGLNGSPLRPGRYLALIRTSAGTVTKVITWPGR